MPLPATLKGAERIACGERCEFEVDGADGSKQTREGVVWNVSEAGVYLVLPADIPEVGTLMRASIWLPGDPRPIRAQLEVAWRNPPSCFSGCGAEAPRFPPGCGLRFVEIAPPDLLRIKARVESVLPNRGERRSR
jgi:PilZ domain-containing protein